MQYNESLESLRSHPLPNWYASAKFGIFIHWGLYSVPAYAPTSPDDIQMMFQKHPQSYVFANQPYAEWYWNSLRIPDSPVERHHRQKYGMLKYPDLASEFNLQASHWNPEEWAELFHQAGARYVVLVTKHHDGFLLWPSRFTNPNLPHFQSARDIVGELRQAVRRKGLHMGYYYSSLLDWSYTPQPIQSFAEMATDCPSAPGYLQYIDGHWRELIDLYQAEVLWSDIGSPPGYDCNKLFAYFYNQMPQGVINDRWMQVPRWMNNRLGRAALNWLVRRSLTTGGAPKSLVAHCDFITTEYTEFNEINPKKWEACRGIGNSFGYNQVETEGQYLTAAQLVPLLVEIASKNGNLLLNVGPRADGSIPEPQRMALLGVGDWLAKNGEAIFDTQPWKRPGDNLPDGRKVFYTARNTTLYVHLMQAANAQLTIPGVCLAPAGVIHLLGRAEPLLWTQRGEDIEINLPEEAFSGLVPVLRLDNLNELPARTQTGD